MQSNQQKMIDFPTKPLKCTIMNWSQKGRKKILLAISVVLIQYTDFLYQFDCARSEKNRDIMILSIEHHLTFFVLFIRCFDLRFNWKLYRSLSERDIFLNFQQTSNNNYFLKFGTGDKISSNHSLLLIFRLKKSAALTEPLIMIEFPG